MKYIALLRGINVGGKSMLKMTDLKSALSEEGLHNVRTLINSGNVIFETKAGSEDKLSEHIEKVILKKFKLRLRVLVLKEIAVKKVLEDVPSEWKKKNKLRQYIGFVISPMKAKDVMKAALPREGIDFLKEGKGVIYMSTKLSGLTKSGLSKLASTEVYQYLTIRNYNTLVKLNSLI